MTNSEENATANGGIPADIAALSFEDAMSELTGIVQALEQGQSQLEESIEQYQRGVALRRHCENKLRDAREKIEKITLQADGSLKAEPFGEEG